MKKLSLALFILFIFLGAIYALLQGSFGKQWVQHRFAKAVEESGYQVQIGEVEGTLPHQIHLKNVTITGKELNLSIQEIQFRPVLWRLLKKELALKHIRAVGVSLSQGPPFDIRGSFRINAQKASFQGVIRDWTLQARFDRETKLARFDGNHPMLHVKGMAMLDDSYRLIQSHLQLSSEKGLSQLPFKLSGIWLAHAVITHPDASYRGVFSWQIPSLNVDHHRVGAVKGEGELLYAEGALEGELKMFPSTTASFHWTLRPDHLLTGTTQLEIENLQSLHIPDLYGKLDAKADWRIVQNKQELHLDATTTDFYYKRLFAQKASLYAEFDNPLKSLTGSIDLELEKAQWNDLELQTLTLQTNRSAEQWPFQLSLEGEWKHPLQMEMEGAIQSASLLDIQTFRGRFFNHPFTLQKPVRLEQTKETFHVSDIDLAIDQGTASLRFDRKKEQTALQIDLHELPVDFLSLNPLDVPIGGTLNLTAHLEQKNGRVEGAWEASVAHLQPLDAVGIFEGKIQNDLLTLEGDFQIHHEPWLHLDASLPIHISLWPLHGSLLFHKEAKGNLSLHGRVEEFLDFFDLGSHRLEGLCEGQLRFSHTLYRPLVEGAFTLQDGFYENYLTGTQLRNIQAHFLAEQNKIYLRSLTGQDQSLTGTVSAEGEIELLQSELYPFHLRAHFDHFQIAETDLATAHAEGEIQIEGNATSALARGTLDIHQADLSIPDHIPKSLPNLQVVYRNQTHPLAAPPPIFSRPYPLHLDIDLTASQPIHISGRGLHSTWNGQFHLGGTATSIATQGKLHLVEGEFNFSSRSFQLTEGSLSFSGREYEMPYLDLTGSMETKGVSILARLSGPLNNPQITLHSVPPLPLGSIMSYLLFGQELSEISGFQALELATSLASLAGTGPDIMESTRRSLGVDRLRIITDPNAQGEETIALQVGKYVSDGVLVSFTQGAEDSSPSISIEVELKNNFVFQLESDQHQEQGKFTLKWSKNY